MRKYLRPLGVAGVAALLVVPLACGDDDDSASTTTTAEATTTTREATTTSASAGPSDVFCQAVEDFSNAQDGAQRNTALGNLADSLPTDAPAAISQALTDLDTGDLPAEAYASAQDALEQYAADNCG